MPIGPQNINLITPGSLDGFGIAGGLASGVTAVADSQIAENATMRKLDYMAEMDERKAALAHEYRLKEGEIDHKNQLELEGIRQKGYMARAGARKGSGAPDIDDVRQLYAAIKENNVGMSDEEAWSLAMSRAGVAPSGGDDEAQSQFSYGDVGRLVNLAVEKGKDLDEISEALKAQHPGREGDIDMIINQAKQGGSVPDEADEPTAAQVDDQPSSPFLRYRRDDGTDVGVVDATSKAVQDFWDFANAPSGGAR